MYSLVLIQARMGSSRLPNKVLKDICGKSDIQRVIERAQKSKCADEVMVITSIEKENLPLIRVCSELGVRVYVGSERDVLDRYYQAAKLIKPEIVVRITGDCPFFDWRYLDQAICEFNDDTDYLWMGENAFPDGLDLEIMRFDSLKKAWERAKMMSEREHVTLYFRNHPEEFNIQLFDFPIKGKGHYRWTLDEIEDYELVCRVYDHFISIGIEDFVTEDIIAYLEDHPEIEKINAMYSRNEGLAKSLKEDREVNDVI